VFQTVSTLAEYLDAQQADQTNTADSQTSAPGAVAAGVQPAVQPGVEPIDILQRLPHGPEFRFISRINEIDHGTSGRAAWSITGGEPFFAGHFPGNPIVPGVLIAEALAQLCGLVGPDMGSGGGTLAHVDVRFEQPVRPPADIILQARLTRTSGALQQFDVSATIARDVIAHGSMTLHRGSARAS
jgi:3-hydroxyacyl-[acyl-carrier-protein] dehydratase